MNERIRHNTNHNTEIQRKNNNGIVKEFTWNGKIRQETWTDNKCWSTNITKRQIIPQHYQQNNRNTWKNSTWNPNIRKVQDNHVRNRKWHEKQHRKSNNRVIDKRWVYTYAKNALKYKDTDREENSAYLLDKIEQYKLCWIIRRIIRCEQRMKKCRKISSEMKKQ